MGEGNVSEVFLFEQKAENVEYENHVRLFSGRNQTIIISIQNISHPELEVKTNSILFFKKKVKLTRNSQKPHT